jgi:hypothetical protein
VLALVLASAALAGCSKTITITQYPVFYKPELKTLAVVPFRNASHDRNAGSAVADHLSAALMSNGTYQVFNRADVKSLLDEHDLQIAFGGNAGAAAAKFKKMGKVQAMLTGTVTTYAATTHTETKQVPQYNYDRNGNRYFTGAYETEIFTRNEANVVVSAALIRVSDGTTIYATPEAVHGTCVSETGFGGSPPDRDQNACLAAATNDAVQQLVLQFAVCRVDIKVDPSKDFRTASDLYDKKFDYTDKFGVDDEQVLVVLKLPAARDRNRFRIVIVHQDEREPVASLDIVWSRDNGSFGYAFSPKEIVAHGGPGKYTAKFYSGPEPAMTHDFTIEGASQAKKKRNK